MSNPVVRRDRFPHPFQHWQWLPIRRFVIAVLLVGSVGVGRLVVASGKARATTTTITLPFNNVGITSDGTPPVSVSFDARGNTYSAQALAAAGMSPGASVTAGGFTFIWPSVTLGSPDNVQATGQTITLPATPGATALGFLGAASDRPLTGTATIAYTDGTTTAATLDFDDWALLGSPPPAVPFADNSIVARMPYRNTSTGAKQTVPVYVFFNSLALNPAKTATSLTLPAATGDIAGIHIFAMAIGPATAAATPTNTAVATSTSTPAIATSTSTTVLTATATSTTVLTATATSTTVLTATATATSTKAP
jgi:hypothetical protein